MTNGAGGGALDESAPEAITAPHDHSLTISEAADACGVDRKEIERLNRQGEFPNAWRADPEPGHSAFQSLWRIPLADLRRAGLAPEPSTDTLAGDDAAVDLTAPSELEELRADRDDWQRRALVAEAIAAERLSALDDTRQALKTVSALLESRNGVHLDAEQDDEVDEEFDVSPAARLRGNWLR
jgi:hypothetical protein